MGGEEDVLQGLAEYGVTGLGGRCTPSIVRASCLVQLRQQLLRTSHLPLQLMGGLQSFRLTSNGGDMPEAIKLRFSKHTVHDIQLIKT